MTGSIGNDGCDHLIKVVKTQAVRGVTRESGTKDSDRADQSGARWGKLDLQRKAFSHWKYDPYEQRRCGKYSRITPDNEVDLNGSLFLFPQSCGSSKDKTDMIILVVSELLQHDFSHPNYSNIREGYQGTWRTSQQIQSYFLFKNVISDRTIVCGLVCGLYCWKATSVDPWGITTYSSRSIPVPKIAMDHIPSLI